MIGLPAVLEAFRATHLGREFAGGVDELIDLFAIVERDERAAVQNVHAFLSFHAAVFRSFLPLSPHGRRGKTGVC